MMPRFHCAVLTTQCHPPFSCICIAHSLNSSGRHSSLRSRRISHADGHRLSIAHVAHSFSTLGRDCWDCLLCSIEPKLTSAPKMLKLLFYRCLKTACCHVMLKPVGGHWPSPLAQWEFKRRLCCGQSVLDDTTFISWQTLLTLLAQNLTCKQARVIYPSLTLLAHSARLAIARSTTARFTREDWTTRRVIHPPVELPTNWTLAADAARAKSHMQTCTICTSLMLLALRRHFSPCLRIFSYADRRHLPITRVAHSFSALGRPGSGHHMVPW